MNTITKKETIDALAESTGFSKKDLSAMYDAVWTHLLDVVGRGDKYSVRGVITATPFERAATKRRNPQNGAVIDVPAKTGLRVTLGKLLKEALNQG